MIEVWYRHHGQRPTRGDIIEQDAQAASTLPPSFEVVGVKFGRRLDEETVDAQQIGLRVEPPSDSISTDAVESIASAFADRWGGTVEFVGTVQIE